MCDLVQHIKLTQFLLPRELNCTHHCWIWLAFLARYYPSLNIQVQLKVLQTIKQSNVVINELLRLMCLARIAALQAQKIFSRRLAQCLPKFLMLLSRLQQTPYNGKLLSYNIQYMFKTLRTPDHHIYILTFQKLLPQS